MANIKSAKKRVKVIAKKTMINKMIKSSTKTSIKKVVVAVEAKDKAAAEVALKAAISSIDKAYAKGIIKKNSCARKKSSLVRLVTAL
ncbi:MAG: 30S ribosomal protein S20 [Anaerotignaceae bacterium]